MGRKVDVDDLVGAGEIADRLGLAHVSSVHNLSRRYVDFPQPVTVLGQYRVWLWSEVKEWARKTRRID